MLAATRRVSQILSPSQAWSSGRRFENKDGNENDSFSQHRLYLHIHVYRRENKAFSKVGHARLHPAVFRRSNLGTEQSIPHGFRLSAST
ncbi:hypothetical protein VTN96DRAFT_2607 [Rasamsonia emersonii]